MATTSTRWGFTLPDPADNVSITALVTDMQTIDSGLGATPCTVGTRPSTPANGQTIYQTDSHDLWVYDTSVTPATWFPLSPQVARLGSNQIANASTTLTAVTDLQFTLAATTSYTLDGFIAYSSATAADAQFGLSLPSGATFMLTSGGAASSATASAASIETAVVTSGPITLGGAGVGVLLGARITGEVTTSTAVGNLEAQWAQLTSTASDTVLNAGSWLRLERI